MAGGKKSRDRGHEREGETEGSGEKEREREGERPVTGRCVACSEGHCWSYERTMHNPQPEYSPYQLTSHYQHCCPITIPVAHTHTSPLIFNHNTHLTMRKLWVEQ